jgi:lambda repressor-like predicted transcriptional regulator
MGTSVHPGRLRLEMARRGWAAVDLAREAHLSPTTVSTALSGRPISQRSVMLIAVALTRVPAVAAIDALILADRNGFDID